jgi:TetR/AcrR family transcriptional repressor of bet genes
MGRPSQREERRRELTGAFARVLANHGYAGATVAAVAAEAGVAPGLVHHHFRDKEDLLESLLDELVSRFRRRMAALERGGQVTAYVDAAVRLDGSADVVAARCWVGVFAEAVRNPVLFARVRRLLDAEIAVIQRRSEGALSDQDSSAVLAFIVGALVVGAFAPRKTAGFAAPALHRFIAASVR